MAALAPYYSDGTFVFGGEGDYFLDFKLYPSLYGYSWVTFYGNGIPNMAPSACGINIFLLGFIETFADSIIITNYVLVYSIYFFPFLGVYLIGKELRLPPFISFLIAVFYVTNPFMINYLTALNQWNVFSVSAMPFIFWSILKYYNHHFKLFTVFGVVSLCFSFSYANPPMLIVIHLVILISTFLVAAIKKNQNFLTISAKYFLVLGSFFLFNMWWILVLLNNISFGKKFYTQSFAESWLNITSGQFNALANLMNLTAMVPPLPGYSRLADWYLTPVASFISLIPMLIILVGISMQNHTHVAKKLFSLLFILIVGVLFFAKGLGAPFGDIYLYFYRSIPFFNVFKTPTEKFGLLFLFLLTLLLAAVYIHTRTKSIYKYNTMALFIYLIFCVVPLLSGNIIPDYHHGQYKVSRKYTEKKSYRLLRQNLNNDNIVHRIFSLPGSGNYQILLKNEDETYYSGMDPVLNNIGHSFLAPHHVPHLYANIASNKFLKLLSIYNIGTIVLNDDNVPWFGKIENESKDNLKQILGSQLLGKKRDSITVYPIIDNGFLPCFYSPDRNFIISTTSTQ